MESKVEVTWVKPAHFKYVLLLTKVLTAPTQLSPALQQVLHFHSR